ncbi:MAG: N-acetyltransferase [Spirochaetaceae bacterium]|nr:MAG: N-acetyltransferase [Spirochaetaceae bacterium]
MSNFTIQQTETSPGAFYIESQDDQRAGVLDYRVKEETLIIDHVGASNELRGTGAARQLVDHAIKWAIGQGYAVRSKCSYGRHVLEKHYPHLLED